MSGLILDEVGRKALTAEPGSITTLQTPDISDGQLAQSILRSTIVAFARSMSQTDREDLGRWLKEQGESYMPAPAEKTDEAAVPGKDFADSFKRTTEAFVLAAEALFVLAAEALEDVLAQLAKDDADVLPFLTINHQIPQPPPAPEGYVSDGRMKFRLYRRDEWVNVSVDDFEAIVGNLLMACVTYQRQQDPTDKIQAIWDGKTWSDWYPC